jgi:hypothetical protein
MEPEGAGTHDEIRLPFEPGDRFIQVHANGAILVVADDYQWNLASVGQAVAVALEAVEQGTRILLGHEVLDDRTTAVLEHLRRTGATVVDFGTVIPPMTWPNGTTPLMTAASTARNDLIEDLLARGVPADDTDDTGATALHHAAYAGNAPGCELLVAAGLDPAAPDAEGRSAADLAVAGGHVALALTLAPAPDEAQARPAGAGSDDVRFGWRGSAKLVALWIGLVGIPVVFGAVALERADLWSIALVGFAAGVVWSQGHMLRAAGPLRLRDETLHLVTLTGVRRLPLADVRSVVLVPARGVNGAPTLLALGQDRLGRPSSARRLHALAPGLVPLEEAERLAACAPRQVVVVVGRGRAGDRVLDALAPALRRHAVPGNAWWDALLRQVG